MSHRFDSCPECGAVLTKGRSLPDHRRFFGLVTKAFEQWPEHSDFRPRDVEHLRAYLLVKAGHTDIAHIPAPPECENPAIMVLFKLAVEATGQALERKAGYVDYRVSSGGVEVITPRSIDFRTVGQKQFSPIREAVEALIEDVIGVKAEQLLRARAA